MSDKFGTVAQVIGPVVDVTFEGEDNLVPPIYTALRCLLYTSDAADD